MPIRKFLLIFALSLTAGLILQSQFVSAQEPIPVVRFYGEYDSAKLKGKPLQIVEHHHLPDFKPIMTHGYMEVIVPKTTLTLYEWFEWPAQPIPPMYSPKSPKIDKKDVRENPGYVNKKVY